MAVATEIRCGHVSIVETVKIPWFSYRVRHPSVRRKRLLRVCMTEVTNANVRSNRLSLVRHIRSRLGSSPGRIGTFPPAPFGAAFTRSKLSRRTALCGRHPSPSRPCADAARIRPGDAEQERLP